MTQTDEPPEEATNPYWSEQLLAVLAEALGDEDRARQTLEGIIQQAQEGKAMQTLSTERCLAGRSATCQRHRPAHVTHPVFPPPPRRQ